MTGPAQPYTVFGPVPAEPADAYNMSVGVNTDDDLAPDGFYEPGDPSPIFDVNQTLARSEGGLIEAVKRAVVTAFRDALTGSDLRVNGQAVYVDLEYPFEPTQYPGIWVQFSPTEITRAGISEEAWEKEEDGSWAPIQAWQFTGRVTLSIVALKSLDRDRLADIIIMNLAFARTPDSYIITDKTKDTRRYRSLITTLDANPYVSMTLSTDIVYPGGQQVTPGVPWQPDVLAYEDSYAFDLLGNFKVKFTSDGTYTLSRIDASPQLLTSIPVQQSSNPFRFPVDSIPRV